MRDQTDGNRHDRRRRAFVAPGFVGAEFKPIQPARLIAAAGAVCARAEQGLPVEPDIAVAG